MSTYSNGSITFGGGIVPSNLAIGGGANSGARLLQQSSGTNTHENLGLAPNMGMDFGMSAPVQFGPGVTVRQELDQWAYGLFH